MDLHSRRDLMDSMSERYRPASKGSKIRILDEVCAATGFHRKYAIGRIDLIETSRHSTTIVHRKWKRFIEFINHNLYGYCHDREIGFTRGRPYKKDGNAHIEQKNRTHVRKLIRTVRRGSRKVRRYDEPRTPLDRLAEMPGADRQKVEQLLYLRSKLDPLALSKIIRRKRDRIWSLRHTRRKAVKPKGVSDMEISRTLPRTPSSPHIVSSNL